MQFGNASKFVELLATYLVLLVVLSTVQDSAFAAALGVVVTAVAITVVVVSGRRGIVDALTSGAHGPDGEHSHLRGSFRRQVRPDEAGRPMPRAPGALVGAL